MANAVPQAMEAQETLSVLLLDDDPDTPGLLDLMLQEDGRFRVVAHASHWAEAVRLAERERPDIVILDLQMPGMDGFTALPMLRRCLPEARIVVMSAFPDPLTLVEAIGQGVDGYIDKSRSWCELLPTLAGLCSLV